MKCKINSNLKSRKSNVVYYFMVTDNIVFQCYLSKVFVLKNLY